MIKAARIPKRRPYACSSLQARCTDCHRSGCEGILQPQRCTRKQELFRVVALGTRLASPPPAPDRNNDHQHADCNDCPNGEFFLRHIRKMDHCACPRPIPTDHRIQLPAQWPLTGAFAIAPAQNAPRADVLRHYLIYINIAADAARSFLRMNEWQPISQSSSSLEQWGACVKVGAAGPE